MRSSIPEAWRLATLCASLLVLPLAGCGTSPPMAKRSIFDHSQECADGVNQVVADPRFVTLARSLNSFDNVEFRNASGWDVNLQKLWQVKVGLTGFAGGNPIRVNGTGQLSLDNFWTSKWPNYPALSEWIRLSCANGMFQRRRAGDVGFTQVFYSDLPTEIAPEQRFTYGLDATPGHVVLTLADFARVFKLNGSGTTIKSAGLDYIVALHSGGYSRQFDPKRTWVDGWSVSITNTSDAYATVRGLSVYANNTSASLSLAQPLALPPGTTSLPIILKGGLPTLGDGESWVTGVGNPKAASNFLNRAVVIGVAADANIGDRSRPSKSTTRIALRDLVSGFETDLP